jgi:YggT family protein
LYGEFGVARLLIDIINLAFELFSLLMLARILLSWFNPDPYNPIVQFLHNTTEPILAPVRRRLPPMGMFDFSPLVVLIAAWVIQQILLRLVISLFV